MLSPPFNADEKKLIRETIMALVRGAEDCSHLICSDLYRAVESRLPAAISGLVQAYPRIIEKEAKVAMMRMGFKYAQKWTLLAGDAAKKNHKAFLGVAWRDAESATAASSATPCGPAARTPPLARVTDDTGACTDAPLHVRGVPEHEDDAAVQDASIKVLSFAADVDMVSPVPARPPARQQRATTNPSLPSQDADDADDAGDAENPSTSPVAAVDALSVGAGAAVIVSASSSAKRGRPARRTDAPRVGMCGWKNFGRSCYVNSGLRFMLLDPLFQEWLDAVVTDAPAQNGCSCVMCLTSTLLYTTASRDCSQLLKKLDFFNDGHQQDAADYFQVLLPRINDDAKSHGSTKPPFTYDGVYCSVYTCGACKRENTNTPHQADLIVLCAATSISASLTKHFSDQETEPVRCSACATDGVDAHCTLMREEIEHAPETLVICMKYNLPMKTAGSSSKIPFPTIDETLQLAGSAYSLHDVVWRDGLTRSAGHFKVFSRGDSASTSWTLYNDEIVSSVSTSSMHRAFGPSTGGRPLMLRYTREK